MTQAPEEALGAQPHPKISRPLMLNSDVANLTGADIVAFANRIAAHHLKDSAIKVDFWSETSASGQSIKKVRLSTAEVAY